MRTIIWLLRGAIFFTLFAFALNNQHEANIKWFFSYEWRAPMVFIVLAAFALGCVFGVLAMLPSWWRQLRAFRRRQNSTADDSPSEPAVTQSPQPFDSQPLRDGL